MRPVHVPTVEELVKRGLAHPTTGQGKATAYRIDPAGQEEIYAAMKHNAEALRDVPARISSRPDPLAGLS